MGKRLTCPNVLELSPPCSRRRCCLWLKDKGLEMVLLVELMVRELMVELEMVLMVGLVMVLVE